MSDWTAHAAELARSIGAAGGVRDRRWLAAVERVPRHLFVPRWYERRRHGLGRGGIVEPDPGRPRDAAAVGPGARPARRQRHAAEPGGGPSVDRARPPRVRRPARPSPRGRPSRRGRTGGRRHRRRRHRGRRRRRRRAAAAAPGRCGRQPGRRGPRPPGPWPTAPRTPDAVADRRRGRRRRGRRRPGRRAVTDPGVVTDGGSRAPTATRRWSPRSCPTATAASPRSPRRRSRR